MWWIYVVSVVGGLLLFIGLILLIRAMNQHKKVKFHIPEIPKEVPVIKETPKDDGILYQDDNGDELNHKQQKTQAFVSDYVEDDDSELEEKFKRKLRYQNMLRKKQNDLENEIDDEDDFENFRNEHCYSKYFTDKGLMKSIQDMPAEVKAAIFGDVFAKIDLNSIKIFDDK